MLEQYPPVMTLSETSEATGKSKNTIVDLIKNNKLHAERVGRKWRIYHDSLIRYLYADPEADDYTN